MWSVQGTTLLLVMGAQAVLSVAPTYIGCFKDGTPRKFPLKSSTSGSVTPTICMAECASAGHTYAGLTSGNECWCASDLQPLQRTHDGQCSTPCAGDAGQICGGNLKLAVYTDTPPAVYAPMLEGCFEDDVGSRKLPLKAYAYDGNTIEMCTGVCQHNGYKYAGIQFGRECFCGNDLSTSTRVLVTRCDMDCPGNAAQKCGAGGKNSVYRLEAVTSPKPTPVREGCFHDEISAIHNKLEFFAYDSVVNTVEECTGLCQHNGYTYAGLQFGIQCYCGNSISSSVRAGNSECSMECPGNSLQTCGGVDRNEIYSLKAVVKPTPTDLVGCFVDYNESRTLPHSAFNDSTTTVQYCEDSCRASGYAYAGLQHGDQCWCGNNLPPVRAGMGECDRVCTGDASATCGGIDRNQVYAINGVPAFHPPALVGCFHDSINDRVFALAFQNDKTTATDCQGVCRHNGYNYAGLEFSTECYCGNSVATARHTLQAECDMNCAGNSSQECGGTGRLQVYEVVDLADPVHPTPEVMGCYKDSGSNRRLPVLAWDHDDTTQEACIESCRHNNYAFAGLQFGRQCFCGNTLSTSTRTADSECNTPCSGMTSENCGGPLRNWVINLEGATPSPPATVYEGCYVVSSPRVLSSAGYTASDNTIEMCISVCRHNGHTFAGLDGQECRCGSDITGATSTPESECNTPCPGDNTKICGGSSRSSIHRIPPTVIPSNDFFGCYLEGALDHKEFTRSDATHDLCLLKCSGLGYTKAALEEGTECWCGNSLNTDRTISAECDTACSGDASQKCGSSNRATVYSFNGPPVSTPRSVLGCFIDDVMARKLDGFTYTNAANTVDECMAVCFTNGFAYAGLQNGDSCYCGDDVATSMRTGLTECEVPCAGNIAENCGGATNNLVYSFNPIPPTPVYNFVGCFKGGVTGPTFSYTSTAMTIDECADVCSHNSHTRFGLVGGNQCVCGSSAPTADMTAPSECNTVCTGNAGENCGANTYHSVYTFGSLPTTPASQRIGCFGDDTMARKLSLAYSSADNTRELCAATCHHNGNDFYALQASTDCYCAGDISTSLMTTDSECDLTAAADNMQNGGGDAENEIWSFTMNTPGAAPASTSVGCFQTPTLNLQYASADNSLSNCAMACNYHGQNIFAMKSNECYCGASVTGGSWLQESECSTACPGNMADTCGGATTMSVRRFSGSDPVLPSHSAVACFKDNVSMRQFAFLAGTSDLTTVERCGLICNYNGYDLFALQNGDSCYCGSAYGNGELTHEVHCSTQCAGDSGANCGGALYNMVYSFGATAAIPDAPSFHYDGCYVEAGNFDLNYQHSSTTQEQCARVCHFNSFSYFTIRDGDSCYCSNSLVSSTRRVSDECETPCAGDNSQSCGATNRHRAFSFTAPPALTPELVGCFKDSTSNRRLTLAYTSNINTIEECAAVCKHNNFDYFGLQFRSECYCGSAAQAQNSERTAIDECADKCSGNSAQICGDGNRNSIYSFVGVPSEPTRHHVGCYADSSSSRMFTRVYRDSTKNSQAECAHACHWNGYKFFGLQNRDECYCGNSLSSSVGRAASTSCDLACSDSSVGGICGGHLENSVYAFNMADIPVFPAGEHLGCYTDSSSNRVLSGPSYTLVPTNTPAECGAFCHSRGYDWFGVEYSNECYCGNSMTSGSQRTLLSDCDDTCSGDSNLICGGGNRINIYSFVGLPPSPGTLDHVGCYEDSTSSRRLTLQYTSSENTIERCAEVCFYNGFDYVGVQDRDECYCGNSLATSQRTISEFCNRACDGNPAQNCGGNLENSIHSFVGLPTAPSPPTHVGCMVDSNSNRIFSLVYQDSSLTMAQCSEVCFYRGAAYSGTQNGNQCWCGTQAQFDAARRTATDLCNVDCEGDNSEKCGAPFLNSVNALLTAPTYPSYNYQGCFRDSLPHKINAFNYISVNGNDRDECFRACNHNGYTYAALQFGRECYCGDDLSTSSRTVSAECNQQCPGDNSQTCGSSGRNEVYSTAATPTAPTYYQVGCFKDDGNDRKMGNYIFKNSATTYEECALACHHDGREYFAIQAGDECYCGDDISAIERTFTQACDTPVAGNPTQKLGGGFHLLMVFKLSWFPNAPSPVLQGCFKDSSSNRRMTFAFLDNSITRGECSNVCRHNGYTYAGLQSGTECWCSNTLTNAKRTGIGACKTKCRGWDAQTCGGSFRNEVYAVVDVPAQPAPVSEGTCRKETSSNRMFTYQYQSSSYTTIDDCSGVCRHNGFVYAGLQNGKECWCGATDNYLTYPESGNCWKACSGGGTPAYCGGPFVNRIFRV
eukprot:TRINITY_DN977_c0_g5_i1.p1 TRINITY_DN977_c0_g5~~TRINITY_DN977_c0_g5_i1.p1  ORF type:complete len:2288 (+),score=451.00 TRINITY_DN977_c0_g5_i1:87-6950(+)